MEPLCVIRTQWRQRMRLTKFDPADPKFSAATVRRMRQALSIARLSTEKQRHGAILFQGGRVLGLGINSYKNVPSCVSEEHISKISIHAEIAACRSHLDVPNTTLYVARVGRNNQSFAHSKPCVDCLEFLVWHTNVKEVVYS